MLGIACVIEIVLRAVVGFDRVVIIRPTTPIVQSSPIDTGKEWLNDGLQFTKLCRSELTIVRCEARRMNSLGKVVAKALSVGIHYSKVSMLESIACG